MNVYLVKYMQGGVHRAALLQAHTAEDAMTMLRVNLDTTYDPIYPPNTRIHCVPEDQLNYADEAALDRYGGQVVVTPDWCGSSWFAPVMEAAR